MAKKEEQITPSASKPKAGWIVAGVILGIIVLLALWYVSGYNSLVTMNENVDGKWSQVETQYQRRVDLIPNLVSTVKGYAKFEQTTLEEITRLRSQWQSAPNVNSKIETANQIESAISKLLVVSENYPELKANQNFLALQDELTNTENKISTERVRYNEAVQAYNTKIKRFPTSIIASFANFEQRTYFKSQEGADSAPNVVFD